MSSKTFNPEKESDILRAVCVYLESINVYFWRNNNVPVFAQSNDGKMRFRAMPKYARRGLPDIFIIKEGGGLVGIEVKRPGANLRPEQAEIMKDFLGLGADYKVVRSVTDIQDIRHLLVS